MEPAISDPPEAHGSDKGPGHAAPGSATTGSSEPGTSAGSPVPAARVPPPGEQQPGGSGIGARAGVSRWRLSSSLLQHRPLPGRARRAARGTGRIVARAWREHPLEVFCVTLMVFAGLIYPWPVWWAGIAIWFAGAGPATLSRMWDLWDKWAALVGPVVLVIFGTAASLVLGGTRPNAAGYLHELSVVTLYLIKASSLVSACYLAWRVHRGRRRPTVPPWRRHLRG